MQRLKFNGVRVIYISQGIDSASDQAESLMAVHGLFDSLYLKEMAKIDKRGLAGRLERGFVTGGKTYGYRSVGVPSGKTDVNGYPELLGKRRVIERRKPGSSDRCSMGRQRDRGVPRYSSADYEGLLQDRGGSRGPVASSAASSTTSATSAN